MFTPTLLRVYSDNPFIKHLKLGDYEKAAFLAQKDQPGGKKTMKSYLWSLEKEAYDQAHQG